MLYMGSKNRIAKHLLPIILKDRKPGHWYVEPFVGGANMIDKVTGNCLGNDSNHYLIALLKAVQSGYKPPTEITDKTYYEIKNNMDSYPDELVGFVGFCCSFGGKFWAGYARNKRKQNYAMQSFNNLTKQAPNLKHIKFCSGKYQDLQIPKNSIIYADPPYQNATKYNKQDFDHEEFWQWARIKHIQGHSIFISEYEAPFDFTCLFEMKLINNLQTDHNVKKQEKLFTYTLC